MGVFQLYALNGESMTISNVHLQGVRNSSCDKSPLCKAGAQKNIWFFKKNKSPPPFFSRQEFSEETHVLKMRLLYVHVGAFALRKLGRQI